MLWTLKLVRFCKYCLSIKSIILKYLYVRNTDNIKNHAFENGDLIQSLDEANPAAKREEADEEQEESHECDKINLDEDIAVQEEEKPVESPECDKIDLDENIAVLEEENPVENHACDLS